jgi:Flp pilus assembly protein TadG
MLLPRPCHRRRGASATELALLCPLLAVLLLAVIDFSRLYYQYIIVINCARNAALYASDPTAAADSPYARLTDAALADAADLSPQPTVSSANVVDDTGNNCIEVTVTTSVSTLGTYPGVSNPMTVSQKVRMRIAPNAPN